MPHITSMAPPTYYGNPGYAVPMPMTTQSAVERSVLARDEQMYDPTINYADVSYSYAKEIPYLDMYSPGMAMDGLGRVRVPQKGKRKLRGMGEEPYPMWPGNNMSPLPTIPRTYPATLEPYVGFLNMDVGVDPGLENFTPYGIGGMGAIKPLTIAPAPDTVSMPVPAPVLPSTKALVIGGALFFVGASIATYIFLRSKKGGQK